MGVVFQNYALFPHMTAGKNVGYPLQQRKYSREDIAAKVAEALAMVELEEMSDRYPNQLSGGQQQRVALARALVFDPDIVLMDEPLGALDRRLREQMQISIRHLHKSLGTTFVFVTHDQSEALTMSDRVAVFSEGRVEQIGAVHEVYEKPETAFVAKFVGENNEMPGTVISETTNGCRVHLDSGHEIGALNPQNASVGERVSAFIRPEWIEVSDAESGKMEMIVRELFYFGDHVRLVLQDGKLELSVKTRGDRVVGVAAGDRVWISWEAKHCRVLGGN